MGPSTYIFAFAMLSAVYAAPPVEKKPGEVVILEQENNFNGVDPWRWSNMTSNNRSNDESGELKDGGESEELPDSSNVTNSTQSDKESEELDDDDDDDKSGQPPESYIWTSPDGIIYNVTYIDDVPMITKIGEGGEPSGEALDPGRHHLSGNAQLSLIGRRK